MAGEIYSVTGWHHPMGDEVPAGACDAVGGRTDESRQSAGELLRVPCGGTHADGRVVSQPAGSRLAGRLAADGRV